MQIPCSVHPQMSAQEALWAVASASGRGVSAIGPPEREPNYRRAFGGKSRTHVDLDTAEVCGGPSDRFCQGQECHWHCSDGRGATTELHRGALLGSRVLCINRRPRRKDDPGIHPTAGSRGSSARSDEDVRLTAAMAAHKQSALSGSPSKPPALPEVLT